MTITRRNVLKVLAAAGVAVPVCGRLAPVYEAYAKDRLSDADVRGPGLESFSRSVCRDCANHCSLAVRTVDGLPVGLRGTPWHPASAGALCVAGQSQMQALFDPDRLRAPVGRVDAGEPGSPLSWEEALSALAERVRPLIEQGRGDRLMVIDGRTQSLGTKVAEAWTQSIPGARYLPLRIEAGLDRMLGEFLHGDHLGRPQFDLAHTGALLLVGFELLEIDGSPVTQMRVHGDRRVSQEHGNSATIYLGPRQGPTAVKSDLWIPCRPGKEREVLLGLAESLARDHPDRDRLMESYAFWVPEAADAVSFARHYSLENVAHRQGLKLEDLAAARRVLAEDAPAVTLAGPALLRRSDGAADTRAALGLNLWTGGFAARGGISWVDEPLNQLAEEAGLPAPMANDFSALTDLLQPLLEIKRSPVDVVICIEANLAHELPGRDQVRRALTHIPYLVSLSGHEDETAQLSHLTLPTLLDLESWDVPAPAWGVAELAVQVQRPAVAPVTGGRAAADVFLALAESGVAGEGFAPGGGNSQEMVAAAVNAIVTRRSGRVVDATGTRGCRDLSAGALRSSLLAGDAVWLPDNTPATVAAAPLVAQPTAPSPERDLAPGQLWLVPFDAPPLQGGRVLNRTMLMELSGYWQGLAWESWVELNPADAARLRVKRGDMVQIRGSRAEIEVRAVVTHSIAEGVVAMPVGLGHTAMGEISRGHGVNPLALPNAVMDRETGIPVWGPLAVFITKA